MYSITLHTCPENIYSSHSLGTGLLLNNTMLMKVIKMDGAQNGPDLTSEILIVPK